MINTRVIVTEATLTGTRTILGHVTAPMMIEELGDREVITHVTVEGHIEHETIQGLPLPIERRAGQEVRLELIPLKTTRLTRIEVVS